MKAEPLLVGSSEAALNAPLLKLSEPLSFWGGVDPKTGRIIQVRHPQCGASIAGTVLAMPGTIGSSSSAAVLLELIHGGHAPAALLLDTPDAILLIGCLVAREMGWTPPPAFCLPASEQARIPEGRLSLDASGHLASL